MADHRALAPLRLADPGPYLVDDPIRIDHIFSQITTNPELVCLYPAGRNEPFVLSALLKTDKNFLIFDASPDDRTHKILLKSPYIVGVCYLDRVHVQFDALNPQEIRFQGQRALQTRYPQSLLFVQRREAYRLSIPTRQPMYCTLEVVPGLDAVVAQVADISISGLGLLGPLPGIPMHTGMRFLQCRLELPEIGIIPVDLQICSTREIRAYDGKTIRIGCSFLQLSGRAQTLIQRYINHIERSRISHS